MTIKVNCLGCAVWIQAVNSQCWAYQMEAQREGAR